MTPSSTNVNAEALLKRALAGIADGPELKRRFEALVVAQADSQSEAVVAKARAALTVAGYDEQACDTVEALAEIVRLAGICLTAGV